MSAFFVQIPFQTFQQAFHASHLPHASMYSRKPPSPSAFHSCWLSLPSYPNFPPRSSCPTHHTIGRAITNNLITHAKAQPNVDLPFGPVPVPVPVHPPPSNLDPTLIQDAILTHRRSRDWNAILREFRSLNDVPGVILSEEAIFACFQAANKLIDWQTTGDILGYLNRNAPHTPFTSRCCVKAMQTFASAEMWDLVLSLYQDLVSVTVPSIHVSNLAMQACANLQLQERALTLLQQLQDYPDQAKPNIFTYNHCLKASEASLEQIAHVMNLMTTHHIPPDVFSYNTCIAASARARAWKTALDYFEKMQAADIEPDVVSFTSSIDACTKAGYWDMAILIFNQMNQYGVAPNEIAYNACIHACSKGGKWEKALYLLNEMEKRGIIPTLHTYTLTISALSNAKEMAKALELFANLSNKGYKPNLITWTACIKACIPNKRGDIASNLLSRMKKSGIKPDLLAYNTTLAACSKLIKALDIFLQMEQDNIQPDVVSYNILLTLCDRELNAEKALEFYQEIKAKHIIPQKLTMDILAKLMSKTRRWQLCIWFVAEMKKMDIDIDCIAYGASIIACAQAGEWDKALLITRNMRQNNIEPNKFLVDFFDSLSIEDFGQDLKGYFAELKDPKYIQNHNFSSGA